MTKEEIIELQRLNKEFAETELGALFIKFERLHASAWQLDGEIQNDWSGETYTKEEAKKYLREYRK
jgi:hypothetical protein